MHRRRTGRKRHHLFAESVFSTIHKGFQVFFKAIDIRSEGYYPIGIECLFDILLFPSPVRHMRQTEINHLSFSHIDVIWFLQLTIFFMSRINQPIAAGFLGASAFNEMLLSKGG